MGEISCACDLVGWRSERNLPKGLTEPLGRRKSDGTMKKSKKAEKDRPFVKRKLAKIGARKNGIRKKDANVACTLASAKKRESGPQLVPTHAMFNSWARR